MGMEQHQTILTKEEHQQVYTYNVLPFIIAVQLIYLSAARFLTPRLRRHLLHTITRR